MASILSTPYIIDSTKKTPNITKTRNTQEHIVNLLLQPHYLVQPEYSLNKLTQKINSTYVTIGHPIYGPLPKNFISSLKLKDQLKAICQNTVTPKQG